MVKTNCPFNLFPFIILITLSFLVLFPISTNASLPSSINVDNLRYESSNDPEIFEFLGKFYKVRWYRDYLNMYPVITHIPDPTLPEYELPITEDLDEDDNSYPDLLEILFMYKDFFATESLIGNPDYELWLPAYVSYWEQKKNFWDDMAKNTWNEDDAVWFSTGLYGCKIAFNVVLAYLGGAPSGLLGLAQVTGSAIGMTTDTLNFINSVHAVPDSTIASYALNAIGNMDINEKQDLENTINYILAIRRGVDTIADYGEAFDNYLLHPATEIVEHTDEFKSLYENIRSFSHFGFKSYYGHQAFISSGNILAPMILAQTGQYLGNMLLGDLNSDCSYLMNLLVRNANLHCAVLANLAQGIVNDLNTFQSNRPDSIFQYRIFFLKLLKKMELFYEVKWEFMWSTLRIMEEMDSQLLCDFGIQEDTIADFRVWEQQIRDIIEDKLYPKINLILDKQVYAFDVIYNYSTLTVTSPTPSSVLTIDDQFNIEWNYSGLPGDNVKIEISRDGGNSWSSITDNTANDGTFQWDVSGPISNNCYIRVTSVQKNDIYNVSGTFSIINYCAGHDIEVSFIETTRSSMTPTQTTNITANILNNGANTETNIDAYLTVIGPDGYSCPIDQLNPNYHTTVDSLLPGHGTQISFTWPSGGGSCGSVGSNGTYTGTISAYSSVGCDENAQDNQQSAGIYLSDAGNPPNHVAYRVRIYDVGENQPFTVGGRTYEITTSDTSGNVRLDIEGEGEDWYDRGIGYLTSDNSQTFWIHRFINSIPPQFHIAVGENYDSVGLNPYSQNAIQGDTIIFSSSITYDDTEVFAVSGSETSGRVIDFENDAEGNFESNGTSLNVGTTGLPTGEYRFCILTDSLQIGAIEYLAFGRFDLAPLQHIVQLESSGSGSGQVRINGSLKNLPFSAAYEAGSNITLEAVHGQDSVFVEWTGDASSSNNPINVPVVGGDINITANFNRVHSVNFTGSGSGNGQISIYGVVHDLPFNDSFDYGTVLNLQALPENGSVFTEWLGSLSGSTNPNTLTVNSNTTVGLNFELNRTLSAQIYPQSAGTILASGTELSEGDSKIFVNGQTAILLAVPLPGYEFNHWSGDATGTTISIQVLMDSDKNLTANFSELRSTLTLSSNPTQGGSINSDPEPGPDGKYSAGTVVTLTANASLGFEFISWSGSISDSNNPAQITINGDKHVTANFVEIAEVISKPGTPTGETNPTVGVAYTYATTGATSSLGHTLEYQFNWGDGTASTWSAATSALKTWSDTTPATVTVTVRCADHINETNISGGLPVEPVAENKLIYIDEDAVGVNNGSSWADAFTDLQDALAIATDGDEIWVAEGIYVPGFERTDSFQMVSGVGLYGGFNGTETTRDERDWAANTTILSGDINGDDDGFTNNDENVYHVVTGADYAVINGFTIIGGNANGSYPNFYGGGIFNWNSSLIIINCKLFGNRAQLGGGGVFSYGSSSVITNCSFIGNSGQLGGAINNSGSEATITNCFFFGNRADNGGTTIGRGGAILNDAATSIIANNIFLANHTNTYGGAICNIWSSNSIITNCTFFRNTSDKYGGAVVNYEDSPTITNSILRENNAPNGPEIYNTAGSSPSVTYSDITGGYSGTGNIDLYPLFADPDGPDGISGTEDDDLHLTAGSPCIDAGDDSASGSLSTDFEGDLRIVDGDHDCIDSVDIGADEYVPSVIVPSAPRNLRVSPGDDFVDLEWDVPCRDGDILIAGYRIHRCIVSGCTSPVVIYVTDTSFRDENENLVPGTTYYYKVTAVNIKGDESDFSNEVYYTPAIFVSNFAEIIGTWNSGFWYWDVAASNWTKMTSYSTKREIAAGDFTGDGKADVASCWGSGLWYQDGATLGWTKVWKTSPDQVAAGDITGDGIDEIIGCGGAWGRGIWQWDAALLSWTKIDPDTPIGDLTAGDFNGDGKADVAACWDNGLWWNDVAAGSAYSVYNANPYRLTAGDITGDGVDEIISTWSSGIWYWDVTTSKWTKMTSYSTKRGIAAGDFTGDGKADVASCWGSGLWYQDGATLGWTKVTSTAPDRVTAGDITRN